MSYSSIGPIGMPKPVAALSMALIDAPSSKQQQGLVHVGQQHAIHQEAGPVVHHDRRLADRFGVGDGRGDGVVAKSACRGSLPPAASAARD